MTFTDPRIKAAFDRVGTLLFKDGYVNGGGTAIVNTRPEDAMDPMFEGDTLTPGCWMQKIPTWYGPDFFPDKRTTCGPRSTSSVTDIGIFAFPTIDPSVQGRRGLG